MSPRTQAMENFPVRLSAQAQINLAAEIEVYALNEGEAQQKNQDYIDRDILPADLDFEDENTGITASLESLQQCENFEVEIDSLTKDEDLSAEEILEAEIEQLEQEIKWDENSLAKHRAFLQSLVPAARGAQGN
jgi:hypothetical protein